MRYLESTDFYLSDDAKINFYVNFTLVAHFYAYDIIYKCAVNMDGCRINNSCGKTGSIALTTRNTFRMRSSNAKGFIHGQ